MTAVDFKPEFTEARYRELLAPMLRGEVRSHRFSTLHRHKDGHDFPVENNLQYVTPAGELPRFVCIGRDISERVKLERLALRTQRLESIGTLASGLPPTKFSYKYLSNERAADSMVLVLTVQLRRSIPHWVMS